MLLGWRAYLRAIVGGSAEMMTNDELDAAVRHQIRLAGICYDVASDWKAAGRVHSEEARQLSNQLSAQRGFLQPELIEE